MCATRCGSSESRQDGVRARAAASIVAVGLMSATASGAILSFGQLDYLADGGGYVAEDSAWGQLTYELEAADLASFVPSGPGFVSFANLTIDGPSQPGLWTIRNLPVYLDGPGLPAGRLPRTAAFDIGAGVHGLDVTQLDFQFTLDPAPRTGAHATLPSNASVLDLDVLYGGLTFETPAPTSGTSGSAPTPLPSPQPANWMDWFGVGVGSSGKIKVPEDQVKKVSELPSHCAPGAVGRSLKYLADLNPSLKLPDIPGQDNKAQIVHDQIKETPYFCTTVTDGTYDDRLLPGKTNYRLVKELGIETEMVLHTIARSTFPIQRIIDELNRGSDVEILLDWGLHSDGSTPGHMAFVSAIERYVDADGNTTGFKVTYIDDPNQEDGVEGNRPGHVLCDANGRIFGPLVGPGARVDGFMIERVPAPGSAILIAFAAAFASVRRRRAIPAA
jgi:hypothetical protein